jgi:hypothetical protein
MIEEPIAPDEAKLIVCMMHKQEKKASDVMHMLPGREYCIMHTINFASSGAMGRLLLGVFSMGYGVGARVLACDAHATRSRIPDSLALVLQSLDPPPRQSASPFRRRVQ